MTDKEIAQRFVNTLNELLEIDRAAIEELITTRVGCNAFIAKHPTVQVREESGQETHKNAYTMSALGLLNGLVGIQKDGWGYIASVHEVVCPKCSEETSKGKTIDDVCEKCGTQLTVGDLVEFRLVEHP